MRNILGLLIMAFISVTACSDGNPEEQAREKGEELWFESQLHDYGQIAEDSDGSCSFQFKNVGKEAIVINRVRSTCGCTVPEWPREPIEPGEEGSIRVVYNTATSGSFQKSIYVYSTAANSPIKLQVKGRVIPTES